jgi:hypothetical protein
MDESQRMNPFLFLVAGRSGIEEIPRSQGLPPAGANSADGRDIHRRECELKLNNINMLFKEISRGKPEARQ